MNWIDRVLEDCEHVETPRSWLWWSLCCSVSAAAGNNYFLRTLKGAVVYKPNIYVMLLGESGLGKGFPVSLSKILVQKANCTRVIAGRSSIQAVIKELSLQSTREGKPPITDSRGFIVNGELSTAIIKDPMALTTLTDLYDGKDNPEWTNLLKGDGAEKLKDPYITALFGSSPAHFFDSVPKVNIEGGYIGRNLIIFEEKRYKDSDLLDEEDDSAADSFPYEKYTPHLTRISENKGRLIPTTQARLMFNEWRREWRANQPKDNTGFINRVPDHSLKVAMCLCLARVDDFNMVITEEDVTIAIEKVSSLVYANKRMVEGKSDTDPLSLVTRTILDILLGIKDNEIRRKQLLYQMYVKGFADSRITDLAIDNLKEIGFVSTIKIPSGKNSDTLLRMTKEGLATYGKFIQGRPTPAVKKVGDS